MHISGIEDQSYVTQLFSSLLTRPDLSLLFISPLHARPPSPLCRKHVVCVQNKRVNNKCLLQRDKKNKNRDFEWFEPWLVFVNAVVCQNMCSKIPQRCIRSVLLCCCHRGLSAGCDTELCFPSGDDCVWIYSCSPSIL